MKFLSTRDLRNRPGTIRKMLEEDDLVLTANGRPFAIIVGLDEGDLERTAAFLRRARAQLAIARMRRSASEKGTSAMTAADIEAETRAARADRARD